MGIGNSFIEQKRNELVRASAHELFELSVAAVIAQNPAKEHWFEVTWETRQDDIDEMILQKATSIFTDYNITVQFKRHTSTRVKGTMVLDSDIKKELFDTYYWSREPGCFVNKKTGDIVAVTWGNGTPASPLQTTGPVFDGTVREWYETFVETIIDAGNALYRHAKVPAETIYVNRDILTILECSVLYRPTLKFCGITATNAGTLSNRFTVFIDDSLSSDSCLVTLVKDGIRLEAEVKILDMPKL